MLSLRDASPGHQQFGARRQSLLCSRARLDRAEGAVEVEVVLHEQPVDKLPDLGLGKRAHQGVCGELVQTHGQHPGVGAAAEAAHKQRAPHVVAEFAAYAYYAGYYHLRALGDVLAGEVAPAVAAVAAALAVRLTEVVEYVPSQARRGLAVADHGVEPFYVPLAYQRLSLLVKLLVSAHFNEPARCHYVGRGVEQHAVGALPVAPGASGLLVIRLQALGHVVVDDEVHVGLVYAHAEGVGGHHDALAVKAEVVLIASALIVFQTSVIAGHGDSVRREGALHPLHAGARGAVDDAAFPLVLADKAAQRGELVRVSEHVEVQVRTVEARDDTVRLAQLQHRLDVASHLRRSRGGEGRDRRPAGEGGYERGDAQVARPEILPPLRDAVSLVDSYERYLDRRRQGGEAGSIQPFRRDIQQLVCAGAHPGVDLALLGGGQGAVYECGADSCTLQRRHLILHERD